MKPYFSVIIPVYNKEAHIKATLDSVFGQTLENFEVVIVNDGSTDGSMNIVSTFTDKRIRVINKKNEGVSSARNLGIQNAKSDLIALLDADDIWYANHLENLKSLIESSPRCGLYCTAYETSYFDKTIVKGKYIEIDSFFNGIVPDYFVSSLVDSIALPSAVAIPKTILEKYDYFNTELRSGQDTELWIRIALEENVAFTSKISVKRIISSLDNHLSQSDKRIDRLKILEKFKVMENANKSFKKYMDINRFSIAIERKMNGDRKSFEKIIKDIDNNNLNRKQRIIIKLPAPILKKVKQLHVFLIKNKVYLSAFR
ncbi:glycosyltransferase family 2 protein [Flavobacteriaceae bacterium LMO-SS05]